MDREWEAPEHARSVPTAGAQGTLRGLTAPLGGGAVSLAPIRGWGRVDVVSNSHLLPTRVARPLLFSAPHAPTPNSFQLESRDQRELGRVERAGESGTRCVQARVGGCLVGIGGWNFHLGFARAA